MADAEAGYVATWSGGSLPSWLNLRLRSRGTWAALVAALIVGLLADQAFRVGTFGFAAALTVIVAAVLLAIVGQLKRYEARITLALAATLGFFLFFRASPWLLWPDLAASLLLMGFAASSGTRGTIFDVGSAELAARAFNSAAHVLAGLSYLAAPFVAMRERTARLGPVARGVVIAIPICALLSALLASADPVFASFFKLNLDLGQLLSDVAFVLIGGLAMAGLLRLAAAEPVERIDGPVWRLGATEALVVLALLDAVFTAFAVAQVLAATGAAAETLRAAGVTYSDYARSGFFQLLWAGGITLAVLVLFSRITALTRSSHRLAFLALSESAVALTLVIVAVAFRRLSLYEDAYGFTMLRLYSHIFAAWMAVVFLFLGAEMLGLGTRRRWFVGATVISALAVLLALNFVNPEAVVVSLNIDHAQSTGKIDADYLAQLSSDATPALVDAASTVDPTLKPDVVKAACNGPGSYSPPKAAFNGSQAEAAEARLAICW